jgi:hypothetical protein
MGWRAVHLAERERERERREERKGREEEDRVAE